MTRLKFSQNLPLSWEISRDSTLVIYDRELLKNSSFKNWIKKFDRKFPVKAGESLKDLKEFPRYMEKICKLAAGTSRELMIVGVGGGSVTDFAGFVASVFRRGTSLTLIPSTWLAAIDSAHGGKTALNVRGFKNQIGTFYFPSATFLVKSLLENQPIRRKKEAYGELLKIALLTDKAWGRDLMSIQRIEAVDIWKFLKPAIAVKYLIVKRDPFERLGIRQSLNLGHTLGHVLEKKFNIAHGIAVGQGIVFASRWSERLGYMNCEDGEKVCRLVQGLQGKLKPMKLHARELKTGIINDKKITNAGKINFIFLKGVGRAFSKTMSVAEIIAEARRQGWVR